MGLALSSPSDASGIRWSEELDPATRAAIRDAVAQAEGGADWVDESRARSTRSEAPSPSKEKRERASGCSRGAGPRPGAPLAQPPESSEDPTPGREGERRGAAFGLRTRGRAR